MFSVSRLSKPVPTPQVDGLVVHHEHEHSPRVVHQGPPPGLARHRSDRLLSAHATADVAAARSADAASSRIHCLVNSAVVTLNHLRCEYSFRRESFQDSVLQALERGVVLARGVVTAEL